MAPHELQSGDELWNASVLKNWIFGHTHWSVDFEHKGVRVVANQKGEWASATSAKGSELTLELCIAGQATKERTRGMQKRAK